MSEKLPIPRGNCLIYVSLPPEILDRLDVLVIRERRQRNRRQTSRSDLVREATIEYLDRMEKE